MSRFFWPDPDLSFLPGIKATRKGEASYFVCHNNNILQLVGENKTWRPATYEELGQFEKVHEHYMGVLGGKEDGDVRAARAVAQGPKTGDHRVVLAGDRRR